MKTVFLKKTLIIEIILLVLTFLGAGFVFWQVHIETKNAAILSRTLSSREDERKGMLVAEKYINSNKENLQKIKGMVLFGDDDVKFIENLEKMAAENGVFVQIDYLAYKENPQLSKDGMIELNIRIVTKGSWFSNHNFIAALETSEVETKIKNVSLEVNNIENSEDRGLWQGSIDMTVLKVAK